MEVNSVEHKRKNSSQTDMKYGVPQGTFLEPLLFYVILHHLRQWSFKHIKDMYKLKF